MCTRAMPERERRVEKSQQAQRGDSLLDFAAHQALTGRYDVSDTCSAALAQISYRCSH